MTDLSSLIERVKSATGPDRFLSIDVLIASGLFVSERRDGDRKEWIYPTFPGGPSRIRKDHTFILSHWHVTGTLDAAVRMIKTALPGWMWKCGTCHVSDDAWICPNFNDPIDGERLRASLGYDTMKAGDLWDVGFDVARSPSGNVPLALVEAFLMAKVALTALEAKNG